MQSGKRLAHMRERAGENGGRGLVMGEEGRDQPGVIGFGQAHGFHHPLDKHGDAVADEGLDGRKRQRRQTLAREHPGRGGVDVGRTVDQCAVEVEYDGGHAACATVSAAARIARMLAP